MARAKYCVSGVSITYTHLKHVTFFGRGGSDSSYGYNLTVSVEKYVPGSEGEVEIESVDFALKNDIQQSIVFSLKYGKLFPDCILDQ